MDELHLLFDLCTKAIMKHYNFVSKVGYPVHDTKNLKHDGHQGHEGIGVFYDLSLPCHLDIKKHSWKRGRAIRFSGWKGLMKSANPVTINTMNSLKREGNQS
jgi:hypothetical protein